MAKKQSYHLHWSNVILTQSVTIQWQPIRGSWLGASSTAQPQCGENETTYIVTDDAVALCDGKLIKRMGRQQDVTTSIRSLEITEVVLQWKLATSKGPTIWRFNAIENNRITGTTGSLMTSFNAETDLKSITIMIINFIITRIVFQKNS